MAETFNSLWVEKHRPATLSDIVIDPDIKADILKYQSSGAIPNLLFYGDAGGGKTTLSRIIVNELLDCQYLYINASDENGIDTVRGKIKDFAERKSIDGKIKVVILDEVDGFSPEGQRALRNVMESYSHTCRFILTCNAINRIISPVVSRCIAYQIEPPLKEFIRRCGLVLRLEGVKVPDVPKFVEYVKKSYPDIRHAINRLQRDSLSGILDLGTDEPKLKIVDDIVSAIIATTPDPISLRKMIIERAVEFNSDYQSLLHGVFNGIYESDMSQIKKRSALIEISTGLYRHNVVMDKEINCYACFLRIMD